MPGEKKKVVRSKAPLKPGQLLMKVRSCEELKAVLTLRIRAHVKDAKLAKELESALADIVAYGIGGGGGGGVPV